MPTKKLLSPLTLALTLLAAPVLHAGPAFVGPENCKSCHKDEYADWERSKHARAFELLQAGKRKGAKKKAGLDPDKDYTHDQKCLKCHTTGYGEPGGFESIETTAHRAGIGCEMCHGPGERYREIHKTQRLDFKRADTKAAGQTYGSEDPQVCKKCHGHADSPFTSKVDDKYTDDVGALMKQNFRAFHDFYELIGDH